MPGNESVTDNMKSFVGGVALKQAFYNIKTYNAQAISTAITNHNADAAHRHLPAVPTTSPPTGTFSYLTNSQTPAWSTLPTSDAVDSSSSSQLATSKAVSTLNTNIGTVNTNLSKLNKGQFNSFLSFSGTRSFANIYAEDLPTGISFMTVGGNASTDRPPGQGTWKVITWKESLQFGFMFAVRTEAPELQIRSLYSSSWSSWVTLK